MNLMDGFFFEKINRIQYKIQQLKSNMKDKKLEN